MSLANKLAEERRARLAAERLLELKHAELSAANRKLGRHALALTRRIGETEVEVATVRDENEKVKSDLTVAHAKVEVAERRLLHSIQTIHDGFAVFDEDGHLLGANRAYLDVFEGLDDVRPGVSYALLLQLMTEEGLIDTGDLPPAHWRAMMSARWHDPEPEPIVVRFWNDMHIKLIDRRTPGGDLVTLALNITSTVRYEAELKAARALTDAADQVKSTYMTDISHEIRTPINGIVDMAELLADTALSDEQKPHVETIRSSGQALLVIIDDVLDDSGTKAETLPPLGAPESAGAPAMSGCDTSFARLTSGTSTLRDDQSGPHAATRQTPDPRSDLLACLSLPVPSEPAPASHHSNSDANFAIQFASARRFARVPDLADARYPETLTKTGRSGVDDSASKE